MIVVNHNDARSLLELLKSDPPNMEKLAGNRLFEAIRIASETTPRLLASRLRSLAIRYLEYRYAMVDEKGDLVQADQNLVEAEQGSKITTVMKLPDLYRGWAAIHQLTGLIGMSESEQRAEKQKLKEILDFELHSFEMSPSNSKGTPSSKGRRKCCQSETSMA